MKKILLFMLSLLVAVGVSAETKSLNWSSEGSWGTWNEEYVDGVKQDAYAKCNNGMLTFKGQWTTIQYWMSGLANGYGRLTVTLKDEAPYDLYVEAAYSEGNSNSTITAGQKSVSIDLVAGKTVDKILFKGGSNWPTDQEASVTISTIEFSKPDFSITMENAGDNTFKILGSAFDGLDGDANVNLSVNNSNSETKWFGGKICNTEDGWKTLVDLSQNIPVGDSKITFKVSDFTSSVMSDGYVYIQYWGDNMTLSENIEVEQNKITITLTSAGIGSMILPFNAEVPTGMKVYTTDQYLNGVVTMTEVHTIEANTPYIIQGKPGQYPFLGKAQAESFQYQVGYLCGTYEEMLAPASSYVLQNGDEGAGFYLVAESEEPVVKPFRAYMTELPSGAQTKRLTLDFGGLTTGVETIEAAPMASPLMYDLMGQRIQRAAKGMYIQEGRVRICK